MILSESDAKQLTAKILSMSKVDSCIVSVSGYQHSNIRLALDSVTTSGFQDNVSVSITSAFGKRHATATCNALDDATLAATVRKSEEIAQLAPEDPEHMPPLGPQTYPPGTAYFDSTADARPETLAVLCKPTLDASAAHGVTSAGFLEVSSGFSALATSNGLFVRDCSTKASFSVSARTKDGTGSGWAGLEVNDIHRLDTERLSSAAVDKALRSQNPVALAPGKYTVILEANAVSDLLAWLLWSFDARSADEGRSFLARKGGGNKLGEKVFGDRVTIASDPNDPVAPGAIYSDSGQPAVRRVWVENGVVKNLIYSRYWAQKSGRDPVPPPTNLLFRGGDTTLTQMIQNSRRAILVTRFWYIRMVDPRTLLLTGLTRDGTFLVEDGKITRPIKNFRFNESPVAVLNHIEALGPAERTAAGAVCVPPLLVTDFNFSSLSDAV